MPSSTGIAANLFDEDIKFCISFAFFAAFAVDVLAVDVLAVDVLAADVLAVDVGSLGSV